MYLPYFYVILTKYNISYLPTHNETSKNKNQKNYIFSYCFAVFFKKIMCYKLFIYLIN